MAENDLHDQSLGSSANLNFSTEQLRALAQSHLVEIEQGMDAECRQQIAAQKDLQRYAKSRRKDRPRSLSMQASEPEKDTGKGPRFRSVQDVLHRLQWDPSMNLQEYLVGYLERFEGIKEMPLASWVGESTDEDFIPQHRIKYVKRRMPDGDSYVVWSRDDRLDRLFGSGRIEEKESQRGDDVLPPTTP